MKYQKIKVSYHKIKPLNYLKYRDLMVLSVKIVKNHKKVLKSLYIQFSYCNISETYM